MLSKVRPVEFSLGEVNSGYASLGQVMPGKPRLG